ncbi:DUF2079 domain-containing protein [Actinoplanes sp. TRM 88003]|uniref:DUF2079 domain-containing protein n=1 Tax=Paractinoplanes aksuensis TaxID=2939490 RepID=A0ABT1DYR5_9ACTN|nr:DUF2079 domain-containing protein [Actinoplanes aksuensis]MCO8276017.1 DUF2079 domain-containing protein [Actinoplanes aksuensis]
MSVAVPTSTSSADRPSPPAAPRATRPWPFHLFVALMALALGGYVVSRLWRDPYRHAIADNVGDQAFFEWVLSYGVHLLHHGGDPFFTDLMNVPDGVNLAANTSITVYAILFAPLTMLAGPQVTFLAVLTLNLAGSAYAWFLFFNRFVTAHRGAAALAGFFCGFAPGFVAHANGHLNWTSGWIAPLVLWRLLKMRDTSRWLRNGLILGVTLAVGFSIAAEGLFFTALAGGVFVIAWALSPVNRSEAREALGRFAAGLGVTAVVAGALLAYPLYMHFAGPQTFKGTGFNQRHYSEDLLSFFAFADRSLAAGAGLGNELAANRTEETSFFGLPLLVLLTACLVMLWRSADDRRRSVLRALMIVGGLFFLISLGPRLRVAGAESDIPLLYALLQHVPLFDSALPARYALVLVGVFGVILAMATERMLGSGAPRPLFAVGLVVALLPIFPLPLVHRERSPEPRFIADGTWERYVTEGGVISALPFAANVAADGQRWQAYTMARGGPEFRIPDGYFLGPDAEGAEGKGRIGALPRATDWLFLRAALYGYLADLDNADRATARADFQRWGVEALFLPDVITGPEGPLFRSAVETTATDLLGPPERVDDVLVWRIRPGVDPVDRP